MLLKDLAHVFSGLPSGRRQPGPREDTFRVDSASLVRLRDIEDQRLVLPPLPERLALDEGSGSFMRKVLQEHDILVALRGTGWKVARIQQQQLTSGHQHLVPDSNLAIVRPYTSPWDDRPRLPRDRHESERGLISALLFAWLKRPETERQLARSRGSTGSFAVKLKELQKLPVPRLAPDLERSGLLQAAELLEAAERGYGWALEAAGKRRTVAHQLALQLIAERERP